MTPTVLDRLLLISELFQKDMARAFDGTPLTPARTRDDEAGDRPDRLVVEVGMGGA